jgi:hypothetical protein
MDEVLEVLKSIDARLKRIEERLPRDRSKQGRHIDPKFRHILRRSMQEKGYNGSDLAAAMWGRRIDSQGKNQAVGRDRISVWLAGKNYPSNESMALLSQFVDIV